MAKVIQFFKESRAELKKVVWPTRDDVVSSIKVVIISTILVALILGLLDLGFTELFRILMKQDGKMSKCWYILHTYTGYEGKPRSSNPSIKATNTVEMITTFIEEITSSLVGHTTFFNSALLSLKN